MRSTSLLFALVLATTTIAACSEPTTSAPATQLPPPASPPSVDPEPATREGLVVGDPAAEGIEPAKLEELVAMAKEENSEALVILKNGKLVYEDYFGGKDEPIMAMSASKSFVSIAYGFLLAEGKLASLDERVEKTLPGFAESDPRKASMTFRHLLTQTSGIDPTRANFGTQNIEEVGIAARCVFEPGTSWQYSNNGVDLLAALAGKLAGEPMDQYLNEKLFRPLGIADVAWKRDSNGVPLGAGEMSIRPLDMAKVGQVMLDSGKWHSQEVVPKDWPKLSFEQSSPHEPLYGLLWWRDADTLGVGLTEDLLGQWRTAGLAAAIGAKLEPLVGKKFASNNLYGAALRKLITKDEGLAIDKILREGNHISFSATLEIGPVTGYNAAGWLGQFLVVIPEKDMVAVRMRRARKSDSAQKAEVDGFRLFPLEVSKIAP